MSPCELFREEPGVRASESAPCVVGDRLPMPHDDTVEGTSQHLVEAAAGSGPVGKRSPADHSAQRDAVVEAHHRRVEARPWMPRPADVVDEVGDHECIRWPIEEHRLFQPEAVDGQLFDDSGEGRLRGAIPWDGVGADCVAANLPSTSPTVRTPQPSRSLFPNARRFRSYGSSHASSSTAPVERGHDPHGVTRRFGVRDCRAEQG